MANTLASPDVIKRLSRSGVLESMGSAHVYRDSLRWLADPAFHRDEGVGAVELGSELPQIVREALG